ncbi:/hypothetical membrane protein [Blumeria hordei DH14]|uniref:/hypothetical membrane protein n=1 Tax=Blumeria graminis f. sp. hordei (strain DH14) TaxID=546991 RepID=N1JKR3_BLUG1|nr:/hypothetical membrane protein [Blumeria hordei DH14]
MPTTTPSSTDPCDGDEIMTMRQSSNFKRLWLDNRGAVLVLCAEACGSCMDAIARYLQLGENAMHPFQVIFARMSMTLVLSTTYMLWTKGPKFMMGHAKIRSWLICRALFGFFGLFCLYYSVHYLPLAEATIFRFLVPLVTTISCALLLHQSFTGGEFVASILALTGIVIIAHPTNINTHFHNKGLEHYGNDLEKVSPMQRTIAIFVASLGVLAASGAYTCIRMIGERAHALLSVIYFSIAGTIGPLLIILLIPGISFTTPRGWQWAFLVLLGLLGFALQFLLTKGLQLDTNGRATSMLYSQIIFALLLDWLLWGNLPNPWSLIGGALVITSTVGSAVAKSSSQRNKVLGKNDEERPLLVNRTEAEDTGPDQVTDHEPQ